MPDQQSRVASPQHWGSGGFVSGAGKPGATLSFRWAAIDNADIEKTFLRTFGAVTRVDSQIHPGDTRGVTLTATVPLPEDARLGDLIFVQGIAVDYKGLADTVQPAPIQLRDLTRPAVSATLAPHPYQPRIHGLPTYVVGDTIRLAVSGTDDRALGWLGAQVVPRAGAAPLRDSVSVNGNGGSWSTEIIVAPGWYNFPDALGGFARDSSGNLSEVGVQAALYDGIRRPYVEVPNNYIGRVADFAYDSVRHRVYLAQPDSQRLAVLDAGTGTFRSPIALPGRPLSVDLVPSEDSLAVVLDGMPYLAIVNLTTDPVDLDSMPLTALTSSQTEPTFVRVAANNRALVVFRYAQEAYVVDFAFGQRRPYPALGWGPAIHRSKDRSTLVTHSQWGFVYRTRTDSVETYPGISLPRPPDLDGSGNYMLAGGGCTISRSRG